MQEDLSCKEICHHPWRHGGSPGSAAIPGGIAACLGSVMQIGAVVQILHLQNVCRHLDSRNRQRGEFVAVLAHRYMSKEAFVVSIDKI